MSRSVKRRTNQVIHGSVYDGEMLVPIALVVESAGEQRSCGSDDGASRLQQEMWTPFAELPQDAGDSVGVSANQIREVDRMGTSVRNAQSAAHVEKADLVPIVGKLADQFCCALNGNGKR